MATHQWHRDQRKARDAQAATAAMAARLQIADDVRVLRQVFPDLTPAQTKAVAIIARQFMNDNTGEQR